VTSGSDVPLWAGRFSTPPAPAAHALGRSLGYDVRLAAQDVAASIAHVGALLEAGLLDRDEARRLVESLVEVGADIDAGRLTFDPSDEDVHSVVERAVTERLGQLGAKLHAGRSRNDLVVTDFRLWLLEHGLVIGTGLVELTRTLVIRALEHEATVMPGTTHARFAQPVSLGHHLLAHAWAVLRDVERCTQWADRTSVSALGAGATATSTLGVDPAATARRLGMRRAFANSIDAVGDRDFVQEFLATLTIAATHASRLAADLVRWTDPMLGWASLDEAYSTGSSMMPQKRNPDTAELARGKAARVAGDFVAITALLQGLPMGYHRDLQEDKEPAFDAADTIELVVPALTGAVASTHFDVDAMRAACADAGLYATDIAEALVKDGMPFREAHRRTGELLKQLEDEGRTLGDLEPHAWSTFGVPGGASLLDPDVSIASRTTAGGPSLESVRAQAEAISQALQGSR
jgi:argininosuccinate lyase